MLHQNAKDHALAQFDAARADYERQAAQTHQLAQDLHQLRVECADSAVRLIDEYATRIVNLPDAYRDDIARYRHEIGQFHAITAAIHTHADKISADNGSIAPGVEAGIAVAAAAFAPTAALAVATTFGATASGTAISALNGAAATQAALVWLGGSTLAAGGLASEVFLALAGPVGWAIGGAALAGTGLWVDRENEHIAEEAAIHTMTITRKTQTLVDAQHDIGNIIAALDQHLAGIKSQLVWLLAHGGPDFAAFGDEARQRFGALLDDFACLAAQTVKKL